MKYLCLSVLVCGSILAAAQIEPDLLNRLAATDAGTKLPIDIVLKAQANALDLDPGLANLPKPERRARVGRVLMDFAQETQRDMLAYLKAKEADGRVEAIKPLWIVNSVGCWATKDVIYEVGARTDVDLVCYDRVPCDAGEDLVAQESGTVPARLGTVPIFALEQSPPLCDGIEPAMQVVNVRGAWNQGYHGEGIVIGFVDTGTLYTHADLRNRLWTSSVYPNPGFNFASYQYSSGHPGQSPYDTLTPLDYYPSHGTFAAGIALADGSYGDASHDTMGIAPAALLMSLPVDIYLHSPYPDTSMENNEMQAFQFAIRPPRDTLNGADLIASSLRLISTWSPRYAVWRAAEENVLAAGLLQVASAGSEGPGAGTIACPGDCPPPWPNPANHPTSTATSAALTVGGTDNDDNSASMSSRGPTNRWGTIPPWNDYAYPPGLTDPDVVMPCINVRSCNGSDSTYMEMSGTSWAVYATAGVAALMLSADPTLTPRAIDSILELYAVRDLGTPGKDNTFGAGRIDCSLAVAYTAMVGTAEPPVATPATQELELWPNPCRGRLAVRLPPTANRQPLELRIHDGSGRLVRRLALRAGTVARVSLAGLPDGIYLVRIAGTGGEGQSRPIRLLR
jgi:subtilisin family serine protease